MPLSVLGLRSEVLGYIQEEFVYQDCIFSFDQDLERKASDIFEFLTSFWRICRLRCSFIGKFVNLINEIDCI